MTLNSEHIEAIYRGKVAKKYDTSMPPFFTRLKKEAINNSSLKRGDRVLIFCCGTGLDFPHILKIIGKKGEIVAVDFSSEMLRSANDKIKKNKWGNVKLIEADITKFHGEPGRKFDIGVCTLGMSIIPDYKSAYANLVSNIKNQGEIIISDMQLATGWFARLNPFTIFLSKKYGGTREGHQNSLNLCSIMKKELTEIRKNEFFFKSYFYCIGKIR